MSLVRSFYALAFTFSAGAYAAPAPKPAAKPVIVEKTYAITGENAGFRAKGKPGFLRIDGEGGKPNGKIVLDKDNNLKSMEVKVALQDLKTGIETRDEHMKEKYLEVKKFPDAVFVGKEIVGYKGGTLPNEFELKGDLTLHGVTKPASAQVKMSQTTPELAGEATIKFELSSFDIKIPEYAGITVAKEVEIQVKIAAKS